jgi:hypothetical protein
MKNKSKPAVTGTCKAVLCVLAVISMSCGRPATADMVGEAIERSGRGLVSSELLESKCEGLYELDGHWTLLLVPATGPDLGALTSAGLPDSLVTRVREAAAGWRRGQYLVQVQDEALMLRALAEDAVRIQRQFVISGQGSVWIVATLKKSDAKGVPGVVSLSSRPR